MASRRVKRKGKSLRFKAAVASREYTSFHKLFNEDVIRMVVEWFERSLKREVKRRRVRRERKKRAN